MPLTYAGSEQAEAPSESREHARKIDPAYTRGELVRVAGALNLAEAELIQGLLIEEGVPSMLRRTRGFDVPDFLAAGPRDVLVPESGAEAAREMLSGPDGPLDERNRPAGAGAGTAPRPGRLVAAVLAGGGAAALVAWGLVKVAG